MFRVLWCIEVLLLISCEALTVPPNEGSLLTTPAPLIDIPFPTSKGPGTPLKDDRIQCQGSRFGTGLKYGSCNDAVETFRYGDDNLPIRIGQRGTGIYAMNLPWRWISSDGLCTFDIIKRYDVISEETTGVEIARSARSLINKCVLAQGGIGGVISGIGMYNSLRLYVVYSRSLG